MRGIGQHSDAATVGVQQSRALPLPFASLHHAWHGRGGRGGGVRSEVVDVE